MPGIIKPVAFFSTSGTPPAPGGVDTKALDFTNITRYRSDPVTVGFTENFSVMMWMKYTGFASFSILFESGDSNSSRTSIRINTPGADDLTVSGWPSTGSQSHNYQWASPNFFDSSDNWLQLVVTFDGEVYRAYKNGSEQTPSLAFGPAITHTDPGTRRLQFFNFDGSFKFDERLHSAAIWSKTLDSDDILDLYNDGDPTELNLQAAIGSGYASDDADALEHWWRFGLNDNLGATDLGNTPVDLAADSTDLDTGDIVDDSPPN